VDHGARGSWLQVRRRGRANLDDQVQGRSVSAARPLLFVAIFLSSRCFLSRVKVHLRPELG